MKLVLIFKQMESVKKKSKYHQDSKAVATLYLFIEYLDYLISIKMLQPD